MNILFCSLSSEMERAAMRAIGTEKRAFFVAPDAPSALRLLGGERSHVILVGGHSTQAVVASCRQLRAAETCRDAVIVAAGFTGLADARTLIEAGADDVFYEAFGTAVLETRLFLAERAAVAIESRQLVEADRERALTLAWAMTAAQQDACDGLSATLEGIGDGVIATDLAGAVVRMNAVAEHLTGWTFAESRGKPVREIVVLVNGVTRSSVESPIARALREQLIVNLPPDTTLIRRDGTEIAISDSCGPIHSSDGAATGAVLVFRDFTAYRLELTAHAQLDREVIFADRMTSVGTLAAGVAHEVNNPLSYASSNIDMAMEAVTALDEGTTSAKSDLAGMLVQAREGIGRVAEIVRGLATFSRIQETRPDVVDLVPLMDLCINMITSEILTHARIVKKYGEVPLVVADGARLGQVFVNLLLNAAHAFPEGRTDANEIRIAMCTDPQGRALVEVSDTGTGIAPDVLGRIFDPFFTTRPMGNGMGLGLAISHGLLTGMGGEISAESELGRGTTLRVRLAPSRSVAAPARHSTRAPPGNGSRRGAVLVIDDEPAIGSSIRRVLSGHDVTVVTTAQDALELLAAGKAFDAILSDLMMPGMTGMDLFRSIVKLHPRMTANVVFLTGGAFTPEVHAFLDQVSNKRLIKPFDIAKLRSAVNSLVHKNSNAQC
jgi:PAS domain S-box-containing protein